MNSIIDNREYLLVEFCLITNIKVKKKKKNIILLLAVLVKK